MRRRSSRSRTRPTRRRFLRCALGAGAALLAAGSGVARAEPVDYQWVATSRSTQLKIDPTGTELRWLPAGTHNWARFVTPEELRRALKDAGLAPTDVTGMVYDPLADEWRLARDSDVNYFATAARN